MDSIYYKYKAFETLKIEIDSIKLDNSVIKSKFNLSELKLSNKTKDNDKLIKLNSNLQSQLENRQQKHDTEILYYKEKAKVKFKYLFLGTGLGAFLVAILTIL